MLKTQQVTILTAATILLTACAQPAAAPTPTAAPPTPAATPTPVTRTELGTIDEAVDQQIRVLMDGGDMPSLSVGIVLSDELVWANNYNGAARGRSICR